MSERVGSIVSHRDKLHDVLAHLEDEVREHGIVLVAARGARGKRVITAAWQHLKGLGGEPFAGLPADGWEYHYAENFGTAPCGLLHVWSTTGEHFPVVEAITGHVVSDDGRPGVMVQKIPAGGPLRLPESAEWTRVTG